MRPRARAARESRKGQTAALPQRRDQRPERSRRWRAPMALRSFHPVPSLAFAKDSERAPFQVEPIGADERYHARIRLRVVGIEQLALPFVGTGFDRAADNDSADTGVAGPLAGDLAAEPAAAIIESDLGPVRWPHPIAVRFGGQGRGNDE